MGGAGHPALYNAADRRATSSVAPNLHVTALRTELGNCVPLSKETTTFHRGTGVLGWCRSASYPPPECTVSWVSNVYRTP